MRYFLILIGSFCMGIVYSQQAVNEDVQGYIIHSVYFGGGSYFVDENQEKEIFDFIRSIEKIDSYQLSIHAHTDNIGSVQYNQWLAAMRSESVIRILERYNFERDMIAIKRFGKFNPLFDNNTWIGRLKNRRVDIILCPIVF